MGFGDWMIAIGATLVYLYLGGTIGLHRLFSHNSFVAPIWFKTVCGVFATLIGSGSILQWVATHRQHHKHSDTDLDPHNAANGLTNLLSLKSFFAVKLNPLLIKRELKDPFIMWFHKWYWWIHAATILLLGSIGLKWLLVLYVIPSTLTIMWIVFSVYWIVHQTNLGYINFHTKDKSRNIGGWWFALITGGESLHNNHHMMPKQWDFAIVRKEFDPASYIIRMIKK